MPGDCGLELGYECGDVVCIRLSDGCGQGKRRIERADSSLLLSALQVPGRTSGDPKKNKQDNLVLRPEDTATSIMQSSSP